MQHISAKEFLEILSKGDVKPYILDVRTAVEYARASLSGHKTDNIPLDQISAKMNDISAAAQAAQLSYVLCKAGKRAEFAAMDIIEAGVDADKVFVVTGGTGALLEAGASFATKQPPSLDRQYHILMGLLVLIGGVFGFIYDAMFFALPALAGVSLLIHGASGLCGIRSMIGKMPWNRSQGLDVGEEISKSVYIYQQNKIKQADNM